MSTTAHTHKTKSSFHTTARHTLEGKKLSVFMASSKQKGKKKKMVWVWNWKILFCKLIWGHFFHWKLCFSCNYPLYQEFGNSLPIVRYQWLNFPILHLTNFCPFIIPSNPTNYDNGRIFRRARKPYKLLQNSQLMLSLRLTQIHYMKEMWKGT